MSSPTAKILIAGCGAIGSIFGCLLRKAGHPVTLLGRERHLAAIRAGGLKMDGLWGSHRAEGFNLATDTSEITGSYDLILVAVKAYDTDLMGGLVGPALGSQGMVISLQNGLGNVESLAERFGAANSCGASILVGARIPEPGSVTVTVQAAPIILGPLDAAAPGSMERCRSWSRLFRLAAIPCEPTDRILSHIWAKVFYNAPLNPLGALLDVHYGLLGEEPGLRMIMDRIIDEAFQVAKKKGVGLLWGSADEYRELFYGKLLPATYDHQSSMLQDLQRGRPTEIHALNGRIWSYGRELAIPTPFNATMTRLMSGREKRGAPPGLSWQKATDPDP